MEPKWGHFGVPKATILAPETGSEINPRFGTDSGRHRDRFGARLGAQIGPKSGPKRASEIDHFSVVVRGRSRDRFWSGNSRLAKPEGDGTQGVGGVGGGLLKVLEQLPIGTDQNIWQSVWGRPD